MTQPPPNDQPEPSYGYGGTGSSDQPGAPHGQQAPRAWEQGAHSDQSVPFAPQPGDPGKRRWPLWTAIGCGLLTLLLLLTAGGVALWLATRDDDKRYSSTETSDPSGGPSDDPASESETPADQTTGNPTGEGDPSDEGDPTDGGDPTDTGNMGGSGPLDAQSIDGGLGSSRAEPAPIGTTVAMPTDADGTFEITFGTPNWDAEQEIFDASPQNTPAPEGQRYVLVPVSVTHRGDGPSEYYAIIGVDYVDSTGTVHPVARGVTSPRTSFDMGTFGDGTTAEHDLVFAVPADATDAGVADVHLVFLGADPDVRVYVDLE